MKRIYQGILIVLLVLAGAGSMPSGLGGVFLLLAFFVAPTKVLSKLMSDPVIRIVWILGLLVYLMFLPMEDVSRAGENMGWFLWPLWQGVQSVF